MPFTIIEVTNKLDAQKLLVLLYKIQNNELKIYRANTGERDNKVRIFCDEV